MIRNALTTRLALAAALAVAAGGLAAQEADMISARDVHDALAAQGYTDIEDVEFDDGMWEAEARRDDRRKIDLRIDPRTGTIYPEDGRTSLSPADIEASLAAAGYSRIHDIEFDDGLWEAEAYDSDGVEWELYLDPRDARIVGRERD